MSREIKIDTDTKVGFNYILQKFYIVNKETDTYRTTEEATKTVLDIVAPNNIVTLERLTGLRNNLEELSTLSYTLSDSGAYVSSIQINDYSLYPLVIDCSKKVLRIEGTNLLFDLTLNESRDSRVTTLQSFYRNFFGLTLTRAQLLDIYNFLISFYIPCVYNIIAEKSEPLTYSNTFALSNWDETSKAAYMCIANPNNVYTNTDIGHIISINTATNTLTGYISDSANLKEGDTFIVSGTTTEEETYTFSADGTYTIKKIDTSTVPATIVANENFFATYDIGFPKCYKQLAKVNIQAINRESSTITLTTNVPNTIQAGDIITVEGTQQEVEGVTVTCNGTYTVGAISGSTITVQETLPTSYTYSSGTHPFIIKGQYIADIAVIQQESGSNKIHFILETSNTLTESLEASNIIYTFYDNKFTSYTITDKTSDTEFRCTVNSYTGESPIISYSPVFPTLQKEVPATDILITVTSTKDEDNFPTGEFIVDNFQQCKSYIETYPNLVSPTTQIYNNINKEVPTEMQISTDLPTMQFLGLYSDVYKN